MSRYSYRLMRTRKLQRETLVFAMLKWFSFTRNEVWDISYLQADLIISTQQKRSQLFIRKSRVQKGTDHKFEVSFFFAKTWNSPVLILVLFFIFYVRRLSR